MYKHANPSEFSTACRLAYVIDLLCISCELVVAVCTLLYLFNLQQARDGGQEIPIDHISRETALGFLSLSFTVATLVVMAIGIEKVVRSGRTAWTLSLIHI